VGMVSICPDMLGWKGKKAASAKRITWFLHLSAQLRGQSAREDG
jgi:hypothetical protein